MPAEALLKSLMFLQEFNPLTSFSLAALFYSVVLFIGVCEGEKHLK